MDGAPNAPDPEAELRALNLLARDVTANRAELERRLPPLIASLGERLPAERFGPVRMHMLRANDLLPDALHREGMARLDLRDHAGAERLLGEAAHFQERSVRTLRAYAEEVPSLLLDADTRERWLWTIRWEIGRTLCGQGRWNQARVLLAEVLEHVRLDGRRKLVGRDLDRVDARLLQQRLRHDGHRVRAALQGLRPKARMAIRPRPTPQGETVIASVRASRDRSPLPGPRSGRSGRAGGAG